MRAILFLLLITISSNVFAKNDKDAEDELAIVGNWQVTTSRNAATDARTVILMLKSDNDILGNNPDTPHPLPITLSLVCSNAQVKKKPVLAILFPNILFKGTAQTIHFMIDKKPPQPVTGTISKAASGNTTGDMFSLDEKATQLVLGAMAGSQSLTVKLDFDKSGSLNSNFTIEKIDSALEPVRKYCMDEK